VPYVGTLERERTTAAAGPDRHRDDERDGDREPIRAVRADLRDLRVGQAAVTDQARADEDGDATEDRREIRLVQRVDPVDVRQPLVSPDAPPLE
jgi:hypothetical protein